MCNLTPASIGTSGATRFLMIGIEWDLERDALNAQSDACVRCIARFLR